MGYSLGMDVEAIAQLITVLVAALAIIWHQQHNTDQLREELQTTNRQQTEATDKLRKEQTETTDKLRAAIAENGQRLARIEGYLRIGLPEISAESDAS